MASAPDTQSQSGSKKDKKSKKKKNAVVTTPSTVRYGPPTVTSTPGMPIGGQPVHPGGYPMAGAVYPAQPPMQPGMYPVYPGQPIVIQGGVPPPGQVPVMVLAGGVPVRPMVPQGGRPPPPGTQARPQQRQLDFTKAMSDFQTMFPTMDREVIETVLRANNGAVDETIDQLLTLSSDTSDTSRPMAPGPMPPGLMTGGHPLPPSQLPPDMFPSPGTTSFPDQPPPYSPPEPNSPFSQYNNSASTQQTPPATTQVTRPVPAPRRSIEPAYETTLPAAAAPRVPPRRQVDTASQNRSNEINAQRAASESSTRRRLSQLNTTRQWNPPMLGELPDDFLRMSATTTAAAAGSPAMVTQTLQDRLDQNSIRRSSLSQQDPETNQILEDERIALFLQNEEFIQQLQRNPEFLSALETDYQAALEGGAVPDNESTAPATPATPAYPATPATPASSATPATPASPATPSSQTSNPAMASRPLPSTPAPELPARPPSFHGATPTSSQSSVNGASGSGAAAAGAISMDDIEFRKKLDHMGKSSKTKFAILAGKFSKKKKTPKKYEVGSGGATDALLGESIYEELDENCLLEKKESRADDNMYAETM